MNWTIIFLKQNILHNNTQRNYLLNNRKKKSSQGFDILAIDILSNWNQETSRYKCNTPEAVEKLNYDTILSKAYLFGSFWVEVIFLATHSDPQTTQPPQKQRGRE